MLLRRDDLAAAWSDVLANDLDDGDPAPGVTRFAEHLHANLDALHATLRDGSYRPHDLTEVLIPKGGGQRALHIPPVRDRIVERALLNKITPWVDPWLGPASYAYRPGLGVADAIQAVARLRDEGFSHVLRTDVDDCFPSIRPLLALRLLGALVPQEALDVATLLLSRRARDPKRRPTRIRGLPQGCALSPMLSNLVLTGLDSALLNDGFAMVRYADDIVVAVHGRTEAQHAFDVAAAALEGVGMRLGTDKTQTMSFAEGFTFLGEDFGPRYPPTLEQHRVAEPERRVLYVSRSGARVRISRGRLLVESPDNALLLDVPSGHVSRLVCFGSVGVTAGTRTWALTNDIDVVFASRSGNYLGLLATGRDTTRVDRLRCQLAVRDDPTRRLTISRALVTAKVVKQIVLIKNFSRRQHADRARDATLTMDGLLQLIPDCTTVDELLGIEGAVAAAYFPILGHLLPDDLGFETRSRRPPMDLPNAVLSYLYTVLLGECETALRSAGLDPAIGVLHVEEANRPSLALDLMEEFRPLVVDQVLVAASRRRELVPQHARTEPPRPGVVLTRTGKAAILRGYEYRMLQSTRGALPGFSGTLRRHLYRQAQRLASTINDPAQEWTGLSWR